MARGRTPKEFIPDYSGNAGADFELWLEDVNDFLGISNVTDADDKKRLFLNLAGLPVRRIVKGLVVTTPVNADGSAGDSYKALTDAVLGHFRPSTNLTSERHKFRQLKQHDDESVTAFVGRLREKVEACEFASTEVDTVENCQVRDQFIVGVKSTEIRKELLKEAKLTLSTAVSKAVALESYIVDSKLYDAGASSAVVGAPPVPVQRVTQSQAQSTRSGSNSRRCMYCGRTHARGKSNCPAADVVCHKCSKKGHFAAVCLSRKVDDARPVEEEREPEERASRLYDSAYVIEGGKPDDAFRMTLSVNGSDCMGLLDTGATRTILTSDIVKPTKPCDRLLRAYNGGAVDTLGMADITVVHGDRSMSCTCFVVSAGSHNVLFGQDVITGLQLLTHVNTINIVPVSITVDENAKPTALPPRRPAFSTRKDIENELKRLVDNDIIEPVREATPWVSPLVPVRKANGSLRLCVDYRELNKNIVRERQVLPTVEEITAELEGATMFSVLDAESGFHQLLLSEESRPLTTFSSHCGLYRFKRLPFGVTCAPEIFQRVVSDILCRVPGVVVYIDDILVYGKTAAEHDDRLKAVLERLKEANLRLNWAKCRVRQTEVKYLGHWLSSTGVTPDLEKVKAIQEMPPPQTPSDVRRFLGMVTYLGKFVPNLSCITEPLRQHCKQEPFIVSASLLEAFKATKDAVASSLASLAYFQPNPDVPTAISTDASPIGLGAILWQQDDRGTWLPVMCASRSLSDVERRYSQLEREMLGVVFGLTRFRQYVLGRGVQVFTDHKPLISIVRKPFDDVPPRLQRWLVALMPFQYTLLHIPGNQMRCADALSRAPIPESEASPAESRSMGEYVSLVLEQCPISPDDIRLATDADDTLRSIRQCALTSSWPDSTVEQYYCVRDQLTVVDGILMLGNRYVIPEALRQSVLKLAHEGHPGVDIFVESLRQRVWWPRLTHDAKLFVERCSECWRRRSNGAQELMPTEVEGVWEKLAVDLVTIEGRTFCSVIDYGSRWPELLELSSTSTTGVIDKLMELFARFGLPVILVSDWGPQFASQEMARFLERLGIQHTKSSPRYPRSNGMVERLHRVIKERLAGLKPHLPFHSRLQQVLFDIRNSQHRMIGTTPAHALFSRSVRTRIPEYISPKVVNLSHQMQAKAAMADSHDSHRGVRNLSSLTTGTTVVLQDGYHSPDKQWRVVQQYGRQVAVTDGRRVLLRNRQHVREYLSPIHQATGSFPTTSSTLPVLPHVSAPSSQPSSSLQAVTRDLVPAPSTPEATESTAGSSQSDDSPNADITGVLPVQQSPARPSHQSPPTGLFREGVVTRAGRQVKLSSKAKESLLNKRDD